MRAVLLLAVVVPGARLARQGAVHPAVRRRRDGALGARLAQRPPVRRDVLLRHGAAVRRRAVERGRVPVQESWERGRRHGPEQVRYMEYPVLSGLYQYANAMRIAEGSWDRARPAARRAAGRRSTSTSSRSGLALAWLVTVWASALLRRTRPWDAALVAVSPLVMVHVFTNFDALATLSRPPGCWRGRGDGRCSPGCCSASAAPLKLYPLLLLCRPAGAVACARRGPRALRVRCTARWPALGYVGWLVNLPVALRLYPRGWWEFFRLNPPGRRPRLALLRRSRYFTGWPGFDGPLAARRDADACSTRSSLLLFVARAASGSRCSR